MPDTLACAYHPTGAQWSIQTTPGRRLAFSGGVARITDARDMPYALRRDDLIIEVEPAYVDWVPDWLKACGEFFPAKAELRLPEGYSVGPAPQFTLTPPDAPEPVPTRVFIDGVEQDVEPAPLLVGSWADPEPPKPKHAGGRPPKPR